MRLHIKPLTRRKLLHMRGFYTRHDFTQRSFYTYTASLYTQNLLRREALTHSKLLHTKSLYARQAFTHSALLHREAFAHRSSYTQTTLLRSSLRKNISPRYFGLQSLHKELPSTNLYYKTCTKSSTAFPARSADQKLQHQNRISTPKRKKDDFETLRNIILRENHEGQN